jgi:hypothetical protein
LREVYFPFDQIGDWTRPGDPTSDPDPLDPFLPGDDAPLIVTAQGAFVELGRLDAVFELDGEEIQVVRTSVNRYVDDFFLPRILQGKELCEERFNMICDFRINQYAFQWAKIMSPQDLSVGQHTLKVLVTYHAASGQDFEVFNNTISFTVYEHDEACHGECPELP